MSKRLFTRTNVCQLQRTDNGDWDIQANGLLADGDALELADVIYNELGQGWKPYPENTPQDGKIYLVTFGLDGWVDVAAAEFDGEGWYSRFNGDLVEGVTAFWNEELPDYYQEQESEE